MTVALEKFVDSGLKIDARTKGRFDQRRWEAAERARARHLFLIAAVAAGIPRRLGGDMDRAALARDKRLSRRLHHVGMRVYDVWARGADGVEELLDLKPSDLGPKERKEVLREGANVDWEKWKVDALVHVAQRRRLAASFAVAVGDRPWGNRAVHRYGLEIDWVKYAWR